MFSDIAGRIQKMTALLCNIWRTESRRPASNLNAGEPMNDSFFCLSLL
ncbi:hypothetical protein Agau_C101709 [Agrobacterium tumefaciens F2]|nr:hypothetical protein Agau_C101709 [Agrobacterium tumefaciens F2]